MIRITIGDMINTVPINIENTLTKMLIGELKFSFERDKAVTILILR